MVAMVPLHSAATLYIYFLIGMKSSLKSAQLGKELWYLIDDELDNFEHFIVVQYCFMYFYNLELLMNVLLEIHMDDNTKIVTYIWEIVFIEKYN